MSKSYKALLVSVPVLVMIVFLVAPALAATVVEPPSVTVAGIDCTAGTLVTGPDRGLCNILSTLGLIFAILQVATLVWFVWSLMKYLTAGGDPEKVKVARGMILWSVIILAVIFGLNLVYTYILKYIGITGTFTLPFFGATK